MSIQSTPSVCNCICSINIYPRCVNRYHPTGVILFGVGVEIFTVGVGFGVEVGVGVGVSVGTGALVV